MASKSGIDGAISRTQPHQPMANTMTIDELPIEVMLEIFSNLSMNDILQARQACSKWYTICNETAIMRRRWIKIPRTMQFQDCLQRVQHANFSLLDVRDVQFSFDQLVQILERCPQLKIIKIHTWGKEATAEQVAQLVACCPGLQELPQPFDCNKRNDDYLQHVSKLPRLLRLSLYHCEASAATYAAIFQGCPRLLELQMQGSSINNETLAALGSSASKLQTLKLMGCPHLTAEGMANIGNLSCLTKLVVATDNNLDRIALERIAKGCYALKTFIIYFNTLYDDHAIYGLLCSNSQSLKELHLYGAFFVTDAHLGCIGKHCRTLTKLCVADGYYFTDNGLQTLSRILKGNCRVNHLLRSFTSQESNDFFCLDISKLSQTLGQPRECCIRSMQMDHGHHH